MALGSRLARVPMDASPRLVHLQIRSNAEECLQSAAVSCEEKCLRPLVAAPLPQKRAFRPTHFEHRCVSIPSEGLLQATTVDFRNSLPFSAGCPSGIDPLVTGLLKERVPIDISQNQGVAKQNIMDRFRGHSAQEYGLHSRVHAGLLDIPNTERSRCTAVRNFMQKVLPRFVFEGGPIIDSHPQAPVYAFDRTARLGSIRHHCI